MEKFIELNRTFSQLFADRIHEDEDDSINIDDTISSQIGSSIQWTDLIAEHRVVILAEAGAGKTQEIQNIAKVLLKDGKKAFFIRIEYICDDLEIAFEVGTYEEFENWLNSNEEGWLFLDSVDEARLKDSRDFERAIKKISLRLTKAFARVHIILTSRVTAWRPKTDLQLCNVQLPIPYVKERGYRLESSHSNLALNKAPDTVAYKHTSNDDEAHSEFKVYSLNDLSKDQVLSFVVAKGIKDSSRFLDDIERQDGWSFTTRPQDLEELVGFWNDNHRVGTRFELMQYSIERRLKERDQNRAENMPFTLEKSREGVRLLAVACVLLNVSAIKIPDGAKNLKGIDVKKILTDWNDRDCQILLNLPIFDEAIYGTIRFHHRSVREYLAAEWFNEQLKNEGSRQKIEGLFFHKQYDLLVVLPSMKQVLSWLALLDHKIMYKVYELEPEIILKGGDPSKLPLDIRKSIITSLCQKIALGQSDRSIEDRTSIIRFALPDIADTILTLLEEYKTSKDAADYLLNLIWQGRMRKGITLAKSFALDPNADKYVRITAIKTLKEIGIEKDLIDVLDAFLVEKEAHDRGVFAVLIEQLETTSQSVQRILKGLENIRDINRYSHDQLGYALVNFIERSICDTVSDLITGFYKFLRHEPVIERSHCKISQQYQWLLPISVRAVDKLIANKHASVFYPESLFALMQAPVFADYGGYSDYHTNFDTSEQIASWSELNQALFWKTVEETRVNKERPLTSFWQVYNTRAYWKFDKDDFELILLDISNRPLLDDKLVAVSLAFQIYKDSESPKDLLDRLKLATSDNKHLDRELKSFLSPVIKSKEIKKWEEEEAKWKRKQQKQQIKSEKDHIQNVKWLNKNYQELRFNGLEEGHISNAQMFLFGRMYGSSGNPSSKLSVDSWQNLISDYGENVAKAFRDGLVNFWRTYTPLLLSEHEERNTIRDTVVFGLSGLEIESSEITGWCHNLTQEDAQKACRYAFHELNSFPNWFADLYNNFPKVIQELVLHEIKWELNVGDQNTSRLYVLTKVSYQCDWLWDSIAKELLQILDKEPGNANDLGEVLKIIEASSTVSDVDLAVLAENKCKLISMWTNLAQWYATWIKLTPESAIPSLKSYLATIYLSNREDATNLAMMTIVNLVGKKRSKSTLRDVLKTPRYLKELYVLMHQYIRIEDDIERANKGVYSPGLRDDAQHARDEMFSLLKNTPGKETYLAMIELSAMHPAERYRNWMMRCAKERAEIDADASKWTVEKITEFINILEFEPTNHKELFELAVQRLLDLKHDLEESDGSIASTLAKENRETGIRKFIAGWCNDRAQGRYVVSQEEEMPDAKRPDCRFLSSLFDAPVPLELKLADNWSGSTLFERLDNQLCGDYLRDRQSNRGIYILFYRGENVKWENSDGNTIVNFDDLIIALQDYWKALSSKYTGIEQIAVIGVDLTKRMDRKATKNRGKAR